MGAVFQYKKSFGKRKGENESPSPVWRYKICDIACFKIKRRSLTYCEKYELNRLERGKGKVLICHKDLKAKRYTKNKTRRLDIWRYFVLWSLSGRFMKKERVKECGFFRWTEMSIFENWRNRGTPQAIRIVKRETVEYWPFKKWMKWKVA